MKNASVSEPLSLSGLKNRMKEKIYITICWLVSIGAFFGIIWAFWYFSDPGKFPPERPCYSKIEQGWIVNRRFGQDEFLGQITQEQARLLAGENIIYYGDFTVFPCDK